MVRDEDIERGEAMERASDREDELIERIESLNKKIRDMEAFWGSVAKRIEVISDLLKAVPRC